jgi:hypothetical protein
MVEELIKEIDRLRGRIAELEAQALTPERKSQVKYNVNKLYAIFKTAQKTRNTYGISEAFNCFDILYNICKID